MLLLAPILGAQQTSITLKTSANPAVFGQPLTLTATVSPLTASGIVTFYDSTTVLGSKTLAGGQAALTTSLLAAGARSSNEHSTCRAFAYSSNQPSYAST